MPSTPPLVATTVRFGRFELQADERRLLIDGQAASLGGRAFNLLVVLVSRPGQLITKNELLERVWPGQVVEENNIAVQIKTLRKLLGGELIDTVPGCGYRFVMPTNVDPPRPAVETEAMAHQPTHLPRTIPPLFGREREAEELAAMVAQHRLVSVIGAGGIGKTLLVQHLLDAQRGAHRHGVCWVELAPVSDPAALPGTIAAALGVQPGTGDALARLAVAVGPLQVLVALDNAEHLLGDVAHIAAQLTEAAPGLHLIVTSQAPLRAAGERVYRLGALAVPDGPLAAAQAMHYGAVRLFVERAQAADASFNFTDANAPVIIDLCRALDGLALAIELAAARAPVLGVQRLAESMIDRLNLLTTSRNRDAPQRQQTLRAALEWSHSFLDAAEQAVFRRLAVVEGSASLELVQQIATDPAGGGPLDAWAMLDALSVLADRSLVSVMATDDRDRPRYRLLDSPRAFAIERLNAAGELDAVRRRHAQALAAQFEAALAGRLEHRHLAPGMGAAVRLAGGGDEAWREALAPDFDNAREAIVWAAGVGERTLALTMATTLVRALPWSAGEERAGLAARCESLLDVATPPGLRLEALMTLSITWLNTRPKPALQAAQGALAVARDIGDRRSLYLALATFAQAAARVHDTALAESALAEMKRVEDPAWPPQCLFFGVQADSFVGMLSERRDRYLETARRLLEISKVTGRIPAMALSNLADAELASGDTQAAVRTGLSLVSSLEQGRDDFALAHARINLCAALLGSDDIARARTIAMAGWPQAERFEMQHYWANYLALLAALEKRPAAAARLIGCSQARYRVRDDRLQANEATAFDRASALARSALGEAGFERLVVEGAALCDEEVALQAFDGEADPAP